MSSKPTISASHPSMTSERLKNNKSVQGAASVLDKLDTQKEVEPEKQSEILEKETSKDLSNIRQLLFSGKVSETIKIDGFVYELQTWNNATQRILAAKIMKMDDISRITDVSVYELAASLVSINSIPAEQLYDGTEDIDDIEKKVYVLSNMQVSVVNRLIEKCKAIRKSAFDLTSGGDSVKK